jgi:acetolactate decarboxylase
MNLKPIVIALTLLTLANCTTAEQPVINEVRVVGEMRNVMWKGQLEGTIYLDTLAVKTNLYGLGPLEYLTGEILVLDGKSYISTVVSDSTMKVEETFEVKAPFFGYTTVSSWSEQVLPDTILTMQHLETYLDQITINATRPFMFKLAGTVEKTVIHIVNLPEGSSVSSPEEAHVGQVDYELQDEEAVIIGFFSTEHKAIFTHHDTFLHMHLMTTDLQKMGHVDEVKFKKGSMMLYLPTE